MILNSNALSLRPAFPSGHRSRGPLLCIVDVGDFDDRFRSWLMVETELEKSYFPFKVRPQRAFVGCCYHFV